MKVYISGKISDLPPHEVAAKFYAAEKDLIAQDFNPVNPLRLDHSNHDQSWFEFMIVDLRAKRECDCIAMLPCWRTSVGAKIEFAFAEKLNLKIIHLMKVTAYNTHDNVVAEAYPADEAQLAQIVENFESLYSRVETTREEIPSTTVPLSPGEGRPAPRFAGGEAEALFTEEDIIAAQLAAKNKPPISKQLKYIDDEIDLCKQFDLREQLKVWLAIKENLIACRIFEEALRREQSNGIFPLSHAAQQSKR